jgi:hypothetical protein
MEAGDVLYIMSIDRLGRPLRNLPENFAELVRERSDVTKWHAVGDFPLSLLS